MGFSHIKICYHGIIRIFNYVTISSFPCDMVIYHDISRLFNWVEFFLLSVIE